MEISRFAAHYDPPQIGVELKEGSSTHVLRFSIQKESWVQSTVITEIRDLLETREIELGARNKRCLAQVVEKLFDWQVAQNALKSGQDLNRVAPGVLEQAKKAMDVEFEKKLLKPGDEGYVYNKKVDFASEDQEDGENSWDDGSDVASDN